MITIHNELSRCKDFINKFQDKDMDLHSWEKYANIIMSDDKCCLGFIKTGEDFWELHIAFDKSYRGKQAKNIIKTGIQWMLDNKTSRVICGIPKESLNVRMLANSVGFTKIGSKENNELYEIRSKV